MSNGGDARLHKTRLEATVCSTTAGSEQPEAQPVSKMDSESSLDIGEHRATLPEAAGETRERRKGLLVTYIEVLPL